MDAPAYMRQWKNYPLKGTGPAVGWLGNGEVSNGKLAPEEPVLLVCVRLASYSTPNGNKAYTRLSWRRKTSPEVPFWTSLRP